MNSTDIPKRIVVTGHPKLLESQEEAKNVSAYLMDKGLDCPHGSLYDEKLRKRIHSGEFELLIAVGGDGTMLRAGHLCAPHDIPVFGINKGRLGFLFQVENGGWKKMLDQLLQGDYWIEKRMMLQADLVRAGEKL